MNRDISDKYLEMLSRGLIFIRAACQAGDLQRAEAIADALHNVPNFLRGRESKWDGSSFRRMFIGPLVKQYPDLIELDELALAAARHSATGERD